MVVDELLTLGQIAQIFGVADWKIRRLFERGFLPAPQRVGCYRVIRRQQLPAVERALRSAGYLSALATA